MSVREELLAIKGSKELLIPAEVHDWAKKNPGSEIYKTIGESWNDKHAGREYRYELIRRMIRIHIGFEAREPNVVSLSIDRTRPQGGYRLLSDVLGDESLLDILVTDALRELNRLQEKYKAITALRPVWVAKTRVAAKLARQRKRKGGGGEKRVAG